MKHISIVNEEDRRVAFISHKEAQKTQKEISAFVNFVPFVATEHP